MSIDSAARLDGPPADNGPWVLAPDAILRAAAGRLHVHTGAGFRHFETADPLVMHFLSGFARPTQMIDALEAVPPHARTPCTVAAQQVQAIGGLIQAGATHQPGGPPPLAQLGMVADALQRVAGSLEAMGPQAEALLAQATGVALSRRVSALTAGVLALEEALKLARVSFVEDQLRALGVSEGAQGLRLHLGSGPHRLEGWINIDAHPAELSLDLRWGLPFGSGSCSHVFLSHVFEHLFYPTEAGALLAEIHRVLAPGGRLRLIVPDIERCIQAYVDKDNAFFADRAQTWDWWPKSNTRLEGFLAYAGAGPSASEFLSSHKYGYDYETLAHALTQAGFVNVSKSGFNASADPALRVDDASRVAGATTAGKPYSLFVEAMR